MSTFKLVIVSNRLPINVTRENGKLVFNPSNGGLATAMSSLGKQDKIWVGWPGIAADDLTDEEKQQIEDELAKHGCHPVHLTKRQIELFYEGYSNDTLWPLFHYFQSLTKHSDDYWDAYKEVNTHYADAVEHCSRDDSMIWVHDYHLMVLPGMLRERMSHVSIGFFLHIPFPSFEIYRLLPQRKDILRGLLGADLIGFHVYDYARHFLSSCLRLLGVSSHQGLLEFEGRMVKTDAYPIGIDYKKFRKSLGESDTKKALESIEHTYKNMKLIVSVDRLDYSKGIPERLDSFRRLLVTHPELIGKVRLHMVAVPSRTEVATYKHLRDQIEQTVSRINGEFGSVDWAPISYQFQNRPFPEVVALYAAADVALVTPIRDGMNLVAKEYVASKQNRPGVLVLSEMTGAIDELPEALSINPSDTQAVADTMYTALTMTKREQIRRLTVMQRRLSAYDVQVWGNDFLDDLEHAGSRQNSQYKKRLDFEVKDRMIDAFKQSESRLIVLDYDGTLKDFVASPRAIIAKPSLKLKRLLKKLSSDPNTRVAIVSGRPKKVLERWFRGFDITLIAEHGAWTRYDGKWSHSEISFSKYKKQLKPLLESYVAKTAGAEIEEKDYSLVWHYRNVAPELAYVRAASLKRDLSDEIQDETIGVYGGEKIIEIKPIEVNKGYAASELEAVYQSDFVLCAGDDYTDEDMFRSLPSDAFTVKVGSGDTKARYQVPSVTHMLRLLEELSGTLE